MDHATAGCSAAVPFCDRPCATQLTVEECARARVLLGDRAVGWNTPGRPLHLASPTREVLLAGGVFNTRSAMRSGSRTDHLREVGVDPG